MHKYAPVLVALTLAACGSAPQSSATASTKNSLAVELPADDLIKAARQLQPQTGPFYQVKGQLACLTTILETPPYTADSKCELSVNGATVAVDNAGLLTKVLANAKAPTGPVAYWQGEVTLVSITQELPPYSVDNKAKIVL